MRKWIIGAIIAGSVILAALAGVTGWLLLTQDLPQETESSAQTDAPQPTPPPETTQPPQTDPPPETTVPPETDPEETDPEETEEGTEETQENTEETPDEPSIYDPFGLYASNAFVYDTATERFLFIKGGVRQQLAPASLTKLFTAYVVLQHMDPETVITVGPEVTWIDPESSVAGLKEGDRITVEMCIQGLLMQSGNDAAYTLAVATGRTIAQDPDIPAELALQVFVGEMNTLALENGLTGTRFANPDGIDTPGHFTDIMDLTAICRLALDQPLIMKYVKIPQAHVYFASGREVTWINTNMLIQPESEYYTYSAVGLKTGFTDNAGQCLLSAFETEDGYLIIGVLGCPSRESRLKDTVELYWYYR